MLVIFHYLDVLYRQHLRTALLYPHYIDSFLKWLTPTIGTVRGISVLNSVMFLWSAMVGRLGLWLGLVNFVKLPKCLITPISILFPNLSLC